LFIGGLWNDATQYCLCLLVDSSKNFYEIDCDIDEYIVISF